VLREVSYRHLFNKVLTKSLACEYISELMVSVVDNRTIPVKFRDSESNKRNKHDLCRSITRIVYHKIINYTGVQLYIKLSLKIKCMFANKSNSREC